MHDKRSSQISDLYQRALAHAPAERARFLRDACGDDDALREEVESLLRFESGSDRFMETPAVVMLAPGAAVADATIGMIGRTLGAYTLTSRLGVGGMGEVYRARDSKLGRDVAIKILPPHFTSDPERRARFDREARVLATLNHPHIGTIYGLEEADGVTGLVLELIEGDTLAERLERGRLSVADALVIARQIADALSAAHDKGIIHRDLKPANIVVQSGSSTNSELRAKVLDFGLAKPLTLDSDVDVTKPPSGSLETSMEGRMLGTPAYMSPQQARGLAVDKRTDIWAFGCVLFEMLSGAPAFDGETISDTLVRVLEREPDWSALPPDTPAACRRLLERCLRKDPAKRLHDIADALIEIDDAIRGAESEAALTAGVRRAPTARVRLLHSTLGLTVLTAVFTAIVLWAARAPVDVRTDSLQVTVPKPPETEHDGPRLTIALSPDGSFIVMALVSAGREPTLWVRGLRSGDARELPGTAGAALPFWSPDSRRIGFFASGKLKTVAVDGSGLTEICDTRSGIALPGGEGITGGSWNQQGLILFWSETGPLQKVSATGGTPVPVTALAEGKLAMAGRRSFPTASTSCSWRTVRPAAIFGSCALDHCGPGSLRRSARFAPQQSMHPATSCTSTEG